MAHVGQNGTIAQTPDEKSYVPFTLAMTNFQSPQLFNTTWKSILTFFSHQHQNESFAL